LRILRSDKLRRSTSPWVIEAIKKALEFDKVEAQWLNVALKKPPATDKTTTASARIVFGLKYSIKPSDKE